LFEQAAAQASGPDAAYHRLWALDGLARARRAAGDQAGAPESVDWMYRYAESVIYPSRDATRRPAGGERRS